MRKFNKIINKVINKMIGLIMSPLTFSIVLVIIVVILLSSFPEYPIKENMISKEFFSIAIVALPTLVVWYVDIENKKNQNTNSNIESFLQIQQNLEKKYIKLMERFKKVSDEKNKSEFIGDILFDADNLLSEIKLSSKMIDNNSYKFYHIDIYKIYEALGILLDKFKRTFNR